MIKWRSQLIKGLEITLPVTDGEAIASAEISSSAKTPSTEALKDYLAESAGGYGHLLDPEACTGFDLDQALKNERLLPYSFEAVEGLEYIVEPGPIPEGAVS